VEKGEQKQDFFIEIDSAVNECSKINFTLAIDLLLIFGSNFAMQY
jgi:hypothetical protein